MSTDRDRQPPSANRSSSDSAVDPRAPRFGQSITGALLLAGAALREPLLIYAVAVILGVAVLSRSRLDPYQLLWRSVLRRIVGRPNETEPAAPHRFAKLLGAVGAVASSLLLLAGVTSVGYAIAALVGVLAALAATTGFCLGCRMYRQVSFLRSRGVLG
ncbi:DUF4395 domain-containing protein [Natrarchaeobius oligotrophus]|uniref:DUF4395 domain-containing protein n=1 Tax=Natrarchaeobius chitinivorans TaxID=1679083 RepID=A0A3N6M632_NATCH|nr:DUF4395 domain-containing protein [Natrarchaeobius chitinivorans]RQG97597.1 DUF4395 domain-containing protein [Natrarchaeobius chitinivorans]